MRRRSRYADVVVTCDERDRGATTVIRHPKLVIEVLSASTAKDDLGAKMREYHEIVELEEDVTVDSRKRWAHVSRRTSAGAWTFEAPLVAGRLEVRSVGATIDLERLYELCGVAEADEPSR